MHSLSRFAAMTLLMGLLAGCSSEKPAPAGVEEKPVPPRAGQPPLAEGPPPAETISTRPKAGYEDRMSRKKQSRLRAHERPAGIHDARNVSVPAAALSAVGGFDVWLPVDADVHLGERLRLAGLEFVYEPAAEAQDTGVTTFGEWRLRYVVQGRLAVDLYARRSSGSLDALVACFHDRHPANRLAVRYALGGRERQAHIETLLARAGELAHQARLRRMSLAALSMLANVAYWSGVRDGLRGSAEF